LRDAVAVFSGEEVVAAELLIGEPVLEHEVPGLDDRLLVLLVAAEPVFEQATYSRRTLHADPERLCFPYSIDEARAAAERLTQELDWTMSENLEVVRRSLDAYSRRDIKTLREIIDPDVELDWSASLGELAGVPRGIDAVLRFYSGWYAMFEMTVIEPERFVETGDLVIVPNVARLRGREEIEVLARSAFVFTVRNRRITHVCLYQETSEAVKAAGLEE
jgi:ketosteroid isomerase-like protein